MPAGIEQRLDGGQPKAVTEKPLGKTGATLVTGGTGVSQALTERGRNLKQLLQVLDIGRRGLGSAHCVARDQARLSRNDADGTGDNRENREDWRRDVGARRERKAVTLR
jgi:hypothetical protein